MSTQLSFDLDRDSALKLTWLHEVLKKQLQPADPLIAPNVPRILAQVAENLARHADALGDGPHAAQFNMVTFMVKKLMAAAA